MIVIPVIFLTITIFRSAEAFSLFAVSPEKEKRPIPLLEKLIYKKVNDERVKYNLPKLEWASNVAEVARKHSEDMGIKGYFAHENKEGKLVSERLEKNGIVFTVSAENIFKCENYPDIVEEAIEGWMASPGHRENILNDKITETGVGVYRVNGKNEYYITQNFIKRALKFIPSPCKLSAEEVDRIFNIVKRTIEKSKYNYRNIPLKDRIYQELISFGIPVEKNLVIEGFFRETPALRLEVDLRVNNGLIIHFTDKKPEDDKDIFSQLVNPQSYSAVILICTTGDRTEYLLIRREEPN